MKIGRWILLALVLGGAGFVAWRYYRGKKVETIATPVFAPNARAPQGVRIKVEVLNATNTKGLARKATTYLRDRGFDVVEVGTSREQRDKTLVLDRSHHPSWAGLVAAAFGAEVQEKPDSLRFIDVTVLVCADWRPPPLPFYP
ncbi:MAG TPA: LytR C-terminal domain-containing protein [Gemmatimonadaceae bacterium]|nr:LytR C-terminal domain-containing protein [Gemmatimonadaceae bacterium]